MTMQNARPHAREHEQQDAKPADDGQPTCRSRQHEPGRSLPLAPGLHVCAACRDFAEVTLVDLPALFDLCVDGFDLRPYEPGEQVGEARPSELVPCDAVASVRAEIRTVLAAWCGLVSVERRVRGPEELTVRKLVGFLAVHLHWLCQHAAAPDLVNELTDLTAAVNATLRPANGFRVAVGACPHAGCGQPAHAEAHQEGDEPYEVACDGGHVWAPERWLSLHGTVVPRQKKRD